MASSTVRFALVLELGHEFAAAVDLRGVDAHEGNEFAEEAAGVEGGGAGVDAGEHASGEGADGAELLELDAASILPSRRRRSFAVGQFVSSTRGLR